MAEMLLAGSRWIVAVCAGEGLQAVGRNVCDGRQDRPARAQRGGCPAYAGPVQMQRNGVWKNTQCLSETVDRILCRAVRAFKPLQTVSAAIDRVNEEFASA